MESQNQPVTLTDQARALTRGLTARAGMALHRAGVHPDIITLVGLAVVAAAAVLIGRGELPAAGVVLLAGLPLDALDGAVARAMQRQDRFGGVLDSTLDRYADAFIFGGLSYHFAVQGRFEMMLAALAALIGSFVVSYVRARAGEAGLSVKIGLFDRFVRVIIILVSLFIPALLEVGVLALAVGTNLTGLQRLWYVYRNIK
ncbi:MAG: CDP-alcohol phosphatidyltransferase family protein [Chloroflexi bacterium]|nr:CDP-alcohol phosphatidyltransferase family protein [Chloroflexota bacterium]MDL1883435.1 CDP-alcohol phosphatidyltransferase family protein [Anaerolineae bacterium CFX8]